MSNPIRLAGRGRHPPPGRWPRLLPLLAALLLTACQTIPDVSGWTQATQSLSGAVVGGFDAGAAMHRDIGTRLQAVRGFEPQAQGFTKVADVLARRGEDYEALFAAMGDYSASLAALSKASANSGATVDAVAGSLNQLLGALGSSGLAGAGFELGKALASEVIQIKAARDFGEAVERADPVVSRVATLVADDLASLQATLGEANDDAIRIAHERPQQDRVNYRRALADRLAALQDQVREQVRPPGLPGQSVTAPLPDKGAAEEIPRVERLLQATDGWYLPQQAAIAQAQKARAATREMVAQARKAVLAWRASHSSLAAAVREKRVPDTARLVATITRLRELVANVKKES